MARKRRSFQVMRALPLLSLVSEPVGSPRALVKCVDVGAGAGHHQRVAAFVGGGLPPLMQGIERLLDITCGVDAVVGGVTDPDRRVAAAQLLGGVALPWLGEPADPGQLDRPDPVGQGRE